MSAVVIAFAASLGWGVADYVAAIKSRRLSTLSVLLCFQTVGLAASAAMVTIGRIDAPELRSLFFAALSGAAQAIGIGSYWRALSIGTMGIVAPITATSAVVPIAVGIATGERPGLGQGVGMGLAVLGVTLVAAESGSTGPVNNRVASGVGTAFLAALAIGLFFVCIAQATTGASIIWVVLMSRAVAVGILATVVIGIRHRLDVPRSEIGGILLIGGLGMAATMLFAKATTLGLVSIVGVIGALYPITTILLAATLLSERLGRVQRGGSAVALAGIALIVGNTS